MATAATKRRTIKRRGLVRKDRRPSYGNVNDVSWSSSELCSWRCSRSGRRGERREEGIQNERNEGVEMRELKQQTTSERGERMIREGGRKLMPTFH